MPLLRFCLSLCPCCSLAQDDWDYQYPSLFGIGTLKVIEGNDYYFALDEGSKLYPGDTSALRDYTVTDGQRAFVYFNELSEKKEGYEYNAQIKHIENILTKDIYSMPADKADSIGDDPINLLEPIWVTGNFLNIKYQFYHSNDKEKPHMLNLVINEAATDEELKPDYLNMEFRHNAFKDAQTILAPGLVSFKLDNISHLLEGKKGVSVRVKSLYDGVKYITFDFEQK